MDLRGGSRGRKEEQPHHPFDRGETAHAHQDDGSEMNRTLDPAETPIESAQPAPGDEECANERQDKTGNVGASRRLPVAFRDVGEAGRHSAAWTGDAEHRADRARGQTEPLVCSEPSRVGFQPVGNGKARNHRQAPDDQQDASRLTDGKSIRFRIVDHGKGMSRRGALDTLFHCGPQVQFPAAENLELRVRLLPFSR